MFRPVSRERIVTIARWMGMVPETFRRKEDFSNSVFEEWCRQVYSELLHRMEETSLEEIREALQTK